MKKNIFLVNYQKTANLHAARLKSAIAKTAKLFPLSAKSLSALSDEKIALLDMMTTRFGKLQDLIGTKIFPLVLDILGENDVLNFRDKLHRLEKLQIIKDANWWMKLREIRNQLAHDYPDDYQLLAKDFNKLLPFAKQLLIFWNELKEYFIKNKILS
jgi:hypothetical protein